MRRFLSPWRGLYQLFLASPRRAARRPKHVRPAPRGRLEVLQLEDRVVPSTPGNFNIDGSLTGSGSGIYDWNNLNPVTSFALPKIDTVQNDAFNSATDDQFTSGQKESFAQLAITTGTSPSKADLTRMYVGHNVAPGADGANDVYLFLGYNRFNTSGSTFAGFELNQSKATYNAGGGVNLPLRTAGDLLITYNFGGSGAPSIGLLTWSGTATSGNWVNPNTGAVGTPEDLSGSGLGVGAVNAGTVSNPFSGTSNPYGYSIPFADGSNPTTFPAGAFGEAAIDLTAALPAGSNATFNWVSMSTRSSSSYNSNLEDVIKPFSIVIPLKGDVRGNIFEDLNADGTQQTGENGLQNWQVQLWNAAGTTLLQTTKTAADGSYDFTGLDPATYHVKEVLQGTYVQTSPTSSTTGLPLNVSVISSGTPATSGYSASFTVQVLRGYTDEGLNFGDRNANATINVTPYNVVYDGSSHTATGTATGFNGVDLSGDLVLTGTRHTNAGTYIDTWAFHDPTGHYNDASGTVTDVISPKLGSVTPDAKSKVYGSADPALTGTLSGFLAGDNVTATYSRTPGETVLGGPYTISATLSPTAALSNYSITYNTANFIITPKAATWTTDDNTKVYGTADPNPLTACSGSGFLASDGVTASYSRVAGETVGTYHITATLSSNVSGALSNYSIINTGATFAITPAAVTVTWASPADITYGTPLGATQLDATASVSGTFVYTPAAGTVLNAGTGQALTVQFTPTDTTDYSTPAPVTVYINVNKAHLTVTADNQSKTYDGSAFAPFTASITGFVNGDTGSVVSGSPGFTGSAVGAVNAGSYTITPTAGSLSAANYDFTFKDGALTINKANPTINVAGYSVTYDGTAHTALGTATGVNGEALAGLDLSGTTHTNAGTYNGDTWAFHDPSGNYNDASGTVNDLIQKANAYISVTGYDVNYDGSAHTATGTATGVNGENLSGLLDLSGTTHTAAGSYGDTWYFAGNSNYNAASGTLTDTINSVLAVYAGGNVTLDAGDSWARYNKYFTDSPGATSWTVTVNYGDGTGTQTLESNGTSTTFNLGHTWTTPGTYTVWVTVTDDLGAMKAVSFTVTVDPLS